MAIVDKKMRAGARQGRRTPRGFTLLELMIVITIMLILAAFAATGYSHMVVHAREAALHRDLEVMRQAIQDYTRDRNVPPTSLQDLVDYKYIGAVPTDPMTRQKDWNLVPCDAFYSSDQTSMDGFCDVTSASEEVSPFEDKPYSQF
ncbi:MAG: type II secretion system protein [Candidatus Acidiferrales bacterium]|jgi:general secretion pathway protein G